MRQLETVQRIASILLLLGVVGVLAFLAFQRLGTAPGVATARIDIPRNGLLTESAVAGEAEVRKEFVGRYALAPIAAGETLKREKLSGAPALPPRGGLHWLGLPIDRASGANAGDVVLVCHDEAQLLRPARLGAMLCSGKQPVCTGLVRATPRALAAVGAIEDSGGVYLGRRCGGVPAPVDAEDLLSAPEDDRAEEKPKEKDDEAEK